MRSGEEEEDTVSNRFHKEIPDTCSVMQIACTQSNTFVLSTIGHIYSWGEPTYALGRKLTQELEHMFPIRIVELEELTISKIACGSQHVLALDKDGRVHSWGLNTYGQLGLGNTHPVTTPKEIKEAGFHPVIRISAESDISFAVTTSKNTKKMTENYIAFAWGNNKNGRLGLHLASGNIGGTGVFPERVEEDCITTPTHFKNPAWGFECNNIEMFTSKRGKVYVYKSNFSHKTALAGYNENEVKKIIIENANLKRKLEIISLRLENIERDIYKIDTKISENALFEGDPWLLKFTEMLHNEKEFINNKGKEIEALVEQKDEQLEIVKENEVEVERLNREENKRKEQVEDLEDDYKLYKILGETERLKHTLEKLKENENARNEISDKETKYKELRDNQKRYRATSEQLENAKNDKKEAESRRDLIKNIIQTREKQLVLEFFEKHQKAVLNELKNMIYIYDESETSSIEALAPNVDKANLINYIDASNELFDQISLECAKFNEKNIEKCVQDKIKMLYTIIKKNIDLRRKKNEIVSGLLTKISYDLPHNVKKIRKRNDDLEEFKISDEMKKSYQIRFDMEEIIKYNWGRPGPS